MFSYIRHSEKAMSAIFGLRRLVYVYVYPPVCEVKPDADGLKACARAPRKAKSLPCVETEPPARLGATWLIIAIPLFRAPQLIPGLFGTLVALADEIAEVGGRIILINDSIDDLGLRAELDAELPALATSVPTELIENSENLGFVRSANLALQRGRDEGEDVVLLNSDALPTPGSFRELAEVAYLDPMTVVVSPRSNNATICNSPYPERFRRRDPASSLRDHRAIVRLLPRITYVPTAVGFCLYIRAFALREFGLFDEIYGKGYNEENDFIRRCNRRGYRAVLANRAFVWHLGNASFCQSGTSSVANDIANRAILDQRYPEYDSIVRRFYSGPQYRTECLASGLIPGEDGRLRIMFDCRLLGPHHNGTSELTVRLLGAFASEFAEEFDSAVLCDHETYSFHRLNNIEGLRRCDIGEARDWPFAAAFRIGQPFTSDDLTLPFDTAAIAGFLMLDTIALDCQQLDTNDLDHRWRTCAAESDILAYISRFSRDQFHRRFRVRAGTIETIALCSTDVEEYRSTSTPASARTGIPTVLVVGNHYPHKAVDEAIDRLRRTEKGIRILALGTGTVREDDGHYSAGGLASETVDGLFAEADVVLFPSHYEGFGLPIMHALAHRKPVVTRRRPAAAEIGAHTSCAANLHLCDTLDELVDLALSFPTWIDTAASSPAPVRTWADAARAIGIAIRRAIARYEFAFALGRQSRLLGSSSQPRLRGLPVGSTDQADVIPRSVRADFEEIAAVLDAYHRRNEAGWLNRFFRSADRSKLVTARLEDGFVAAPQSIDAIELSTSTPHGLRAMQPGLQSWIKRLAPGGRLVLRIDHADQVDSEFGLPTIDAMLVLLANGGCAPLSRFREGSIIGASAVKLFDWNDGMGQPGNSRQFVEYCYKRILGREGDSAGIDHHSTLAEEHGRQFVVEAFYLSQERFARVRSSLTEYFAG